MPRSYGFPIVPKLQKIGNPTFLSWSDGVGIELHKVGQLWKDWKSNFPKLAKFGTIGNRTFQSWPTSESWICNLPKCGQLRKVGFAIFPKLANFRKLDFQYFQSRPTLGISNPITSDQLMKVGVPRFPKLGKLWVFNFWNAPRAKCYDHNLREWELLRRNARKEAQRRQREDRSRS